MKKTGKKKKGLNGLEKDKPTTMGLIGSFLIPLAGGVAYLKQKDDYPKSAKSYGVISAISLGLTLWYSYTRPKN